MSVVAQAPFLVIAIVMGHAETIKLLLILQ